MSQKERWHETLHSDFGQYFSVEKVLFNQKTEHQELVIFQNTEFGRVMALDGVVQTTERDEFIYHEMMAHVPLFAHGNAKKKVLIIGGGDGAMLREVCRHTTVEQIVMVEIDRGVVEFCKEFLPKHNREGKVYQDPRLKLVIDDGAHFVEHTKEKFDIIISDCTDPIGSGENLFKSEFYQSCANCLNPDGILVAQNGVCFLQQQEVIESNKKLKKHFRDVSFYQAAIPSYYGGIMTFAWATNNPDLRQLDLTVLKDRFKEAQFSCRYYNPAIHLNSFALPQYLLEALAL